VVQKEAHADLCYQEEEFQKSQLQLLMIREEVSKILKNLVTNQMFLKEVT
jgi:hypothetical protein